MGDKIGNVARKERRDPAATWTSNNPIPLDGEWCLETDTGNVKIGDGILAWTVLSYVNQIEETFDISAANKTMTLPKVTGYPQEYSFFWTGGDGTFKATTAVTNSETVGGAAAATWTGEGKGSVTYVSNRTNWEVKHYEDVLDIADDTSGTESYTDRQVRKYVDGCAEITGTFSDSSIDLTTSSAGWFTTSLYVNAPYGYTLVSGLKSYVTPIGLTSPAASAAPPTTTNIPLRPYRGSGTASLSISLTWRVLGTWK